MPAISAIISGVLLAAGGITWAAVAIGSASGDEAVAHDSGTIGADTTMGGVEIRVADLPLMQEFYERAVGLEVIEQAVDSVVLGAGERALLTLQAESPEEGPAAPNNPTEAGLFHSAILFPSAQDLAATLQRIATEAPETYQGSADHLVSEAFYFGDPEGNGLELYVDRPRDQWQWDGDRVQMGSELLDVNQFIADNLGSGGTSDTVMGHVHLRVGDTAEATRFYSDIIGFDVTSESDGAVFLSAGGYHHHLAANSWNSAGAGVRSPGLGLVRFTVTVGSADEVEAIGDRLHAAGVPSSLEGNSLTADDPWGNTIRVVAK